MPTSSASFNTTYAGTDALFDAVERHSRSACTYFSAGSGDSSACPGGTSRMVVACTRTSEPKGTRSRALPTSTMAAASVTSTTVPEWPPCSSASPMTAATTGVVGPGRGGVARAPRRPGGD